MGIESQVAVISGVGNRFGKATAYALAANGIRLALVSRKEDISKEIINEVKARGGDARFYGCDSTVPIQVKPLVEKIISDFGRIDILFNNVGGSYTKRQKLEDLDEELWDSIIRNNLKSTFLLSKYIIPHMKRQGGGSIINVSAAFRTLIDGNNAYGTAKMGIIGMTKNLASEYAEDNIRVNCVCPGVVREDSKGFEGKGYIKKLYKKGQSEDVASIVKLLASEESCWITGQTITMDGGEEVFVDIPKP